MFSSSNKFDLEQKFHRSLNLAKLFFQNKDYQAAKTFINDLLEAKPDSSEAYKLLSQINEALGENEFAIQNYQKSLELKSMETNNLFNDYHFSPSKMKSITRLSGQIKNGPEKGQTTPSKGDETDNLKFIEKLMESKFVVLMNSIEYFKENFSHISRDFKENILSLRQELKFIDQKISTISAKHETLEKTLLAKQSDSDLKKELKKISNTLEKFSLNVDEKFNELNEKIEKIQTNPYSNEEEDYFDHYVNEENDIDENYECDKQDNCQQGYFRGIQTGQQLPQLKDLFSKQKDNKWICKTCEVANDDSDVNCTCCEAPRNPIQQQKNESLFSSPPNQNSQFVFGFPSSNFSFPQIKNPSPSTVANESPFAPKPILEKPAFSFNNTVSNLKNNRGNDNDDALTTNQQTSVFNFNEKPQTSSLFKSDVPFDSSSFSKITPHSFSFGTPNAKTDSGSSFQFTNFSNNAPVPSFEDSNEPKSPLNIKSEESIFSLDKSQKKNGIDLSKIQFNVSNERKEHVETEVENDPNNSVELVLPKVSLPENYEHVTGEEDEQEVFNVQRAKLFIIVGEEYKERGTGSFKILQDKNTKKLRLVMRRDQVHKVCLNIRLTPEIEFKNQEKYILFQCIDFSDNKPTPQTCLLKLRDADKVEFRKFIDDYIKNKSADGIVPTASIQASRKPESIVLTDEKGKDKSQENDIELIYEKPLKSEHKKIIEELKLPLNFFNYEEKPKCKGCIGCRVDDLDWNDLTCSTIQEDNQTSSSNSLGFFSNFSTDLKTEKIDNLQFNNETIEEPISFVSEKSKLLPQNYKHTTGEEGEEIVYKERAKLYRFISENCEFKERGVGEIKILKKQHENDYRLLMRRDIVHKLICNHKINPELLFKNSDKSLTSLTWGTIDFSENPNGENQIFLIKFKDEKRKKEFLDNIEKCVKNLKT